MTKPKPRALRPENWEYLEVWGQALSELAKTGETRPLREIAELSGISVNAMGEAIVRVARGEDAREVFGQKKVGRGRQSEYMHNYARAMVYWEARVRTPEDIDGAVQSAQRHFDYLPAPTPATIRRIARQFSEPCLEDLEYKAKHKGGPSTTSLRKYIAAHSKRGKYI